MKRARISSTDGKTKDKACSNGEEELDRLTNLPAAIILHILSFVDSKLAVQMSLLSKRWTNLWTYVPALNFYSKEFSGKLSFENFIRHFLKRHDASNIPKLYFQNLLWLDESVPTMVIKHAVSRQVREIHLDLILGYPTGFLEHGALGYTNSLTTLKLEKFHITKYLNFPLLSSLTLDKVSFSCNKYYMTAKKTSSSKAVGNLSLQSLEFPFLKTLILRYIKIGVQRKYPENKNLCIDLFSGFVNLENLEMSGCSVDHCDSFIINCPRLVNLKISKVKFTWSPEGIIKLIICALRLKSFKLELWKANTWFELSTDNSTKLHSFHLHTADPYLQNEEIFHKVVNIFKVLNSVRSLNLTMGTIRTLSYAPDSLENKTCPFDNLEICKVDTRNDSYGHVVIPAQVMRYLRSGNSKLKEVVLLH